MADSGVTLIRSKLLVPSPAGLLHRPRVCQRVAEGLERKLTLVSAPAGYGKTSALVDFAQHSPVPVCWYTVDERDRDLSLFIAYLVGAVGERFPGFGDRTREALVSSIGELFRDSTVVVGDLVNEMLEIEEHFVLVVDNYEMLNGAFGTREFVHRLLEVLPPNCHLMLGSRTLPDVPVTHLVAKRQLVGLTDSDLRFQPQEIQELLRLSQIEISEEQAEMIVANAEGWVTGVLLLTDLLREGARAALLNAETATVHTYTYLATEVLSRQPPDVQRFLRTSSVLREMSSRTCRAVLGIDNPRAMLAEVERRNLFITRFGEGGAAIYRYHNLFRDFLHGQLRQQDPARYAELNLRAADWFDQENDVEEAIYHYLAAETYPEAAALMERVAMEWFTRGRVETLLRWAEALPDEMRDQAPWLSLYRSRVLTDRYDYEGARQALAYAESGFAAKEDLIRLSKVHIQRATLGLFESRYEYTLSEARVALEMLNQDNVMERAGARRLIGRAYIGLGRLGKGITELEEALVLYRRAGSPYDVVNLLQDLTLAFASQGCLEEAAASLNEALALARRLDAPAQLAGVLNNLGMLHYVCGEYREALALYQEGLAAARRGGDLRGQANIAEGLATIYRDAGAYRRAESFYDAAWQITRGSRPGLAILILAERADMYRWQGEHERALALVEQARRLAEERNGEGEQGGLLPMTEGIALAEGGDPEAGLRLLFDAVCFLEQRGARRELARARFLLAKACLLTGDKLRATKELRRAMDLMEEIETRQPAVVEGQHAQALVELGVDQGVAGCCDVAEAVQRLRAFGKALMHGGAGPEEEMTGRLEIYALGEGRVVRDGHPIPTSAWQAAMAKELFFYILLHGPVERDAIGLVFWPDLSAEKMRNNFHSTLYRVRQAVGGEAVVVEGGQYQLGNVDCWFDVEEFETLVERARLLPSHDWQAKELWQRAEGLYEGDFLSEVDRAWCVPKREALRGKYIEALIGVGDYYKAQGTFEEAIVWYRRTLEVDPLREEVHRRIMRCYAETDQRAAALAQYCRCQELLEQELGVEPSLETRRLHEQIAGMQPG